MFKIILTSLGGVALGLSTPISAQSSDTAYLSEQNNLSAEDDLALRQVIARLNHALDAEDYALYGSFFADDGVFVSDFGDAVGPQQVAAALDQVRPFIRNRRHVAGNLVISGEGDRAVVSHAVLGAAGVALPARGCTRLLDSGWGDVARGLVA